MTWKVTSTETPIIELIMMDQLEMLTQREQLMEDIDCIITDYFAQYDVNYDEELVKILCDAVCRNFPTN